MELDVDQLCVLLFLVIASVQRVFAKVYRRDGRGLRNVRFVSPYVRRLDGLVDIKSSSGGGSGERKRCCVATRYANVYHSIVFLRYG